MHTSCLCSLSKLQIGLSWLENKYTKNSKLFVWIWLLLRYATFSTNLELLKALSNPLELPFQLHSIEKTQLLDLKFSDDLVGGVETNPAAPTIIALINSWKWNQYRNFLFSRASIAKKPTPTYISQCRGQISSNGRLFLRACFSQMNNPFVSVPNVTHCFYVLFIMSCPSNHNNANMASTVLCNANKSTIYSHCWGDIQKE